MEAFNIPRCDADAKDYFYWLINENMALFTNAIEDFLPFFIYLTKYLTKYLIPEILS